MRVINEGRGAARECDRFLMGEAWVAVGRKFMELSDRDRKLVDLLRRRETAWRSARLITLAGSVVIVFWAVSGWLRGESLAATALFCIGLYLVLYTLASWDGRPEIELLLKLVDHHTKSTTC